MNELINKARNGDKEALTKLILDMHDYFYVIARMLLKDYQYIDDVIQDTTVKAFSSISDLNDNKSFKNWITKILKNTCKTYNKKINFNIFKIKRYEDLDEEANIKGFNTTDYPDNNFELNELIQVLNYKERQIIELKYFECMKIKDIAKELKIKEGTVKSNLFRARNKIKEKNIKLGKNEFNKNFTKF